MPILSLLLSSMNVGQARNDRINYDCLTRILEVPREASTSVPTAAGSITGAAFSGLSAAVKAQSSK